MMAGEFELAGQEGDRVLRNTSVAGTARTIRSLDLAIMTDTMVAHLAGALGVPV